MTERDYRVRVDITFAPDDEGAARGLYNHCKNQLSKGVNIDGAGSIGETSFISLERCGHRIGESCEEIEREELP